MGNFSISLSGLLSNEKALNVVSNNLANLNTTGYKGESTQFADLFAQQLGVNGSGDPLQVGLGTAITGTSTQFTQGPIQSTGQPTDLAIQGDGFFQVQRDGVTMYTRDGSLSQDSNGYLVTQNGAQLMGFPATNGVVNAGGSLVPIQINKGLVNPPNPTSTVQLGMNLDAGAKDGTTFNTSIKTYDSLGQSHLLTYTLTKTGAGAWSYQISMPAAEVKQVGTPTDPVVLKNGTLHFDGTGTLDLVDGAAAANVPGVTLPAGDTMADGASTPSFTWTLFDSKVPPSSMITQQAGASTTSNLYQDGYAAGSVSSFTIGADGTVQEVFSNGQVTDVGQVALAVFPNQQGLLRTGQNNYMVSLASGLPAVGPPGTDGRGLIQEDALESSNVDIASAFAQLILAQRGYEANAKAFTTNNTVTADTLNMVQG